MSTEYEPAKSSGVMFNDSSPPAYFWTYAGTSAAVGPAVMISADPCKTTTSPPDSVALKFSDTFPLASIARTLGVAGWLYMLIPSSCHKNQTGLGCGAPFALTVVSQTTCSLRSRSRARAPNADEKSIAVIQGAFPAKAYATVGRWRCGRSQRCPHRTLTARMAKPASSAQPKWAVAT
jgi:hypothetical protein